MKKTKSQSNNKNKLAHFHVHIFSFFVSPRMKVYCYETFLKRVVQVFIYVQKKSCFFAVEICYFKTGLPRARPPLGIFGKHVPNLENFI